MTEAAGASVCVGVGVGVFVRLSLSGGDELRGFNFAAPDSDGPGGCHGNLPDQVRESLLLVINHPACHGGLGPVRQGVACNWRWIDAAMFSEHVEQKFGQLKVVKIITRSTHTL